MSQLALMRSDNQTRCGNCGRTEEESGIPVTTVVIDWRADLLCDGCVRSFDWSGWTFDPILNIYRRADSFSGSDKNVSVEELLGRTP